jgi:hypothetical protein
MNNRLLLVMALGLLAAVPFTKLQAQPSGPPAAALNEMAKLKFMAGSWRGDGWM